MSLCFGAAINYHSRSIVPTQHNSSHLNESSLAQSQLTNANHVGGDVRNICPGELIGYVHESFTALLSFPMVKVSLQIMGVSSMIIF